MLEKTNGDVEQQAQMERDYQLKKLINGKCEEQLKIEAARKRWALLRKKKKVIVQISNLGVKMEEILRDQTQKEDHNRTKEEKANWQQKMIIPPNNYWNMQWNNITVLIFIIYMFMLPLFICFDKVISRDNIDALIIFDIVFMIDRCADLFVGSYNQDGQPETKLWEVI